MRTLDGCQEPFFKFVKFVLSKDIACGVRNICQHACRIKCHGIVADLALSVLLHIVYRSGFVDNFFHYRSGERRQVGRAKRSHPSAGVTAFLQAKEFLLLAQTCVASIDDDGDKYSMKPLIFVDDVSGRSVYLDMAIALVRAIAVVISLGNSPQKIVVCRPFASWYLVHRHVLSLFEG